MSLDSQALLRPVREDEAIIVAQINQALGKRSPEALRSFTQSYDQLSNLVGIELGEGVRERERERERKTPP